jgi:acyl dehydratase
MSIDWQIARPARVGDTIRCRLHTTAKRAMRDAGVIIEGQEVVDHRGDLVQSGRFTFLIARRPTSPS